MALFDKIVGDVLATGFNGIGLMATNPADILAPASWRYSGLPASQAIGSGTILDSARFRFARRALRRRPDERARLDHRRIIDFKGSTSYGIGMGLARIMHAILRNQQVSLPFSTLLKGDYGQDGIYIAVPGVIGRNKVQRVVELKLDATEREQFARSASALRAVSEQFGILR